MKYSNSLESIYIRNLYKNNIMITDFQVYIALMSALLASVLAIRLGATLYQ
jgi:photosystem I reaction center subunit XII